VRVALQGKITKTEREEGDVRITLSLNGKVDSTSPTGREAKGEATFSLAARFADTIRLGDVISVTIVTEGKEGSA
jgi:hypothetical protein